MTEVYDYRQAIIDDIREFINENNISIENYESEDDMLESLNEMLWVEDSVTGNASGSYTFSTWRAEEYLCHNMDLATEAINEFGGNVGEAFERGAEYVDVTIRCYLLGECLYEVVSDMFESAMDGEEDEEDVV